MYRWTLLHCAAFRGALPEVESLVDKGADVNARDDHGVTPLTRAASQSHADIVEFLTQHGATQ